MKFLNENNIWELLRLGLGFIFLWAFLDKLFGLGFATKAASSWLSGASPTKGFLSFGVEGPFSSFFNSLSGLLVVDYLFMLGLLGVGLALILGIGVRIAGYAGSLMMLLIYLSLFPPENNPVVDEHIIYIIVLLGLSVTNKGGKHSLASWWSKTKLVKRYPLLA